LESLPACSYNLRVVAPVPEAACTIVGHQFLFNGDLSLRDEEGTSVQNEGRRYQWAAGERSRDRGVGE
jgi:hypothetical protein